jgi:hypothetical protein
VERFAKEKIPHLRCGQSIPKAKTQKAILKIEKWFEVKDGAESYPEEYM